MKLYESFETAKTKFQSQLNDNGIEIEMCKTNEIDCSNELDSSKPYHIRWNSDYPPFHDNWQPVSDETDIWYYISDVVL